MKFIKKLIQKYINLVNIKNNGYNNSIEISDNVHLRKVRIKIHGNNNKIIIKKNAYLHNVHIRVGFRDSKINNTTIEIGENTSFNSADFQLGEDGSTITIGDDCMFSFNIEIACSDTHSITDLQGNLLNKGKSITIGSHVWVCKDVKIMKNTCVPPNSVIAQGSIVTGRFHEKNSIIAGIPAKIVKKDINWLRQRPNEYQLIKK